MKNSLNLIITSFLILLSFPLYADDDHEQAKRLVESGEILALDVILEKAKKIQLGKVLEVELETENDKKIYEIELLSSDGTVFELKFNAKTGKHISTEKED